MSTKLEKLLAEIDPSRTIDVVERRINKALVRYHRQKNRVDSWEEYKECLSELVQIMRGAALNLNPKIGANSELDFKIAIQYLEREYPEHTYRIVYEIMSTETEGGVFEISRTLARIVAEDISKNEIRGRTGKFLEKMTVAERLAAADEYIEKYKDILPRKTQYDTVLIKVNFLKVLEEHPRMIKRMRDLKHSI